LVCVQPLNERSGRRHVLARGDGGVGVEFGEVGEGAVTVDL